MKYSTYLILILFLLSSCTNMRKTSKGDESKPDMVFILVDDQAWNVLSRDGRYHFLKTPHLDQLCDEGLVFENAFVTTSLCSPSRACFMTGSYAHSNGVYINEHSDPNPSAPYMPTALQKAGYETAFVGKWHMKRGAQPRDGFDYWLSFDGQGDYIDPELNENGRDFVEKGYMTEILTDYAIRWIEQPREKPYALFLWHKAVHAPFTPAPKDSAAFADAEIPEYDNWYEDMADKPEWMRRGWYYGVHNQPWKDSEGKPVPPTIEPRPWDPKSPKITNYLRAMIAVDDSYGRVRKTLADLNQLDNTVILFSSDNGYFIGAQQRGDKRLMFEESIRIPMMIRYPKLIEAGRTNSELILNIDVAPSLIELAGGKIPDEMQGLSFVPILKNQDIEWRESFMYEYFQEPYAPGLVTMNGVRNHRYKYIEYPNEINDINELYDLETDPGEMDNKINHPDYEAVKAELINDLNRLKAETGYFDPKMYKK